MPRKKLADLAIANTGFEKCSISAPLRFGARELCFEFLGFRLPRRAAIGKRSKRFEFLFEFGNSIESFAPLA